jgi:hypothetical protein
MHTLQEMTPKDADAFKGATMKQITDSMIILELELHKIGLIRRSMMAAGSKVFIPTEHGIEHYTPHSMC